jgi:hypothetical protein
VVANDAPRRAQHDSHIRLRVAPVSPGTLSGHVELLEAQDLLDELCEDQLTLSMNLACLERATNDRPRDPASIAALLALEARVTELGLVRDALAVLQLATIARSVHPAFLPDAPLAEYLRGVYAWMHAVLRALDQLVAGIVAMRPDWATYRWRIEEANNFHFHELERAILGDLLVLFEQSGDEPSVAQLADAFEALLAEAHALETGLDARFG